MFTRKKRSFFERLTGSVSLDEEPESEFTEPETALQRAAGWSSDAEEMGELSVDMYQTPNEIVIHAMVSGVKPEDLSVSITRETVTITGKREEVKQISEDEYHYRELSWGSFSRTIVLPVEIEPEEAEAIERHGLLTVRLPKVNKDRVQKLKVRTG